MARVDPEHWLYKFAPREWLRAAIGELSRAEQAMAQRDRRAGLASCRRAAGMALNGVLALADTPDARYGRSYMDHLGALEGDEGCPVEAREAARVLLRTPLPGGEIVALRTDGGDTRLLEATRTVMAHAYACVLKATPDEGEPAED
jgi:hypothetical protein